MDSNPHLFLFLGPSGVGKSTLIKKILQRYPQISYYPSYTTRDPRQGEINGKNYFFISEPEFTKKIKEGLFIEIDKPHNHYYYGISKEPLTSELFKGKSFVKEVALNGLEVFLKTPLNKYIVSFFLKPYNQEDIAIRLKERNAPNDIGRMKLVKREMEYASSCRHEILIKHNDIDFGINQAVILLQQYLSENADFQKS